MDRPGTDHDDRPTGDPTDHPTDHGPVSLAEAADRLGISPNAVRQRLKRGTLAGHKTPSGWVVIAPTDHPTAADRGRSATHRPPEWSRPSADRPTDQVDIAPLAELIGDLTRENRRLAETAAILAERNRLLSERLLALEAGSVSTEAAIVGDAPVAAPDAPGSTDRAGAASPPSRRWWRFWGR